MTLAELTDFVATSKTLATLDAELVVRAGGGTIEDDADTVARIADDLAALGVTDTAQLDKLLVNAAADIPTLYERLNAPWLAHVQRSKQTYQPIILPRGCAVLYLTFLLAAKDVDKLTTIGKYITPDAVASAAVDLPTPTTADVATPIDAAVTAAAAEVATTKNVR